MGDTERNKNFARRSRPLSGCTRNSLDSSYYQDNEPLESNISTPKIISSPLNVFIIVRDFDERKKDLVRSIGFSGLLQLSRFFELDPKFSLWLLSKVRWNKSSIHPCDKISFVIRPDHIGKIIGIPYSGIEVKDKAFESEDQKIAFMKLSLSFLRTKTHILEAAEEYIQQDLPFGFTKEEANRFKVAFVIFVMGRFLVPSRDPSIGRFDFWGALKNPDAIHSFNWSSFVLGGILEASRLVIWDTLRNINVTSILGCPLILQILYLDIMDIGSLKLPHDVVPRVKHFNSSLLRAMIESDIVDDTTTPTYGRAKDLRSDNTCYNLIDSGSSMTGLPSPTESIEVKCAQGVRSASPEHHGTLPARGKLPIIQDNSSHFRTHVPHNSFPDSDVPDFSATMRDYFQGQVDASLLECFRFHQAMCLHHFSKFSNGLKAAITKENITLVSKVVNHQRRCSGLSAINLEVTRPSVTRRNYDDMLSGAESGDDSTPAQPRKKHGTRVAGFETPLGQKGRSIHRTSSNSKTVHVSSSTHLLPMPGATLFSPSPSEDNRDAVNFTTPEHNHPKCTITSPSTENWTISPGKFGLPILSAVKAEHRNYSTIDSELSDSSNPKKHVQPGRLAVTHWLRNIDHPTRDFALTRSFFDWLSSTTSADLKKPWIVHEYPRFIQITGKQLKDHFTNIQPMAFDAFDLCVRRIRQLDKAICPKDVQLRWRHLLESDFAMQVLEGEKPAGNLSIRNQFVSNLIDYHLERCRMFVVPVFLDGLWWCYAWDLKSHTLTISDPSVGQESDSLVIQKHVGTIQLLNKFLSETILHFYTGWDPQFHACNIVVFRTTDMPIERSNSAFFTLFFIKNFNGTNLVTASSPSALQLFKEYMLYEMLELKENQVTPPSCYIHSIND